MTDNLPVKTEKIDVIRYAIDKGADIQTIEKMMELQERWERNEARKLYVSAMAKFKSNPPKIFKNRKVSYSTTKGQTEYHHATLGNITEMISKSLSEFGLSAAWTTEQPNGKITVTCTITHEAGYSESTSLSAEPDLSGSKNPIQAIGSTVTYLQRYTILALTGLATYDQDDDGMTGGDQFITEDQVVELTEKIREAYPKDQGAKFLKWLGVETVDTIPVRDYGKAIGALRKIRGE